MKIYKKFLIVFACSILLGLAAVLIFPTQSKAGEVPYCDGSPLDPACNILDDCTTKVGCNYDWFINYEGYVNPPCKKCIYWEGCVFECQGI